MMAILYQKDWMNEEWNQPLYQSFKQENFQTLSQYLEHSPDTLLDIGCGLAFESRQFNQQHGTRLWLLDGNFDDNDQNKLLVQARYNRDAKDFAFYYNLDVLENKLIEMGTQNYTLVDAGRIDLPEDLRFDLITSWMSCGFHYPVNTYRDLVKKHSHAHTVIVMDLRRDTHTGDILLESGVEIVEILQQRRKYATCHIRLI